MKKIINKNRIMFISIVSILTVVAGLYTSYALNVYVSEGSTTEYDLALDFDLSSALDTSMTIASGKTKVFDLDIYNPYSDSVQYGVAYSLTGTASEVVIAESSMSKNTAVGLVSAGATVKVTVVVVNNSSSSITVSFSVINGYKNGGSLIVPTGKTLITEKYYIGPPDFSITSILVNNTAQNSLGSGLYSMTSSCSNVSYDRLTRKVKVTDFSGKQNCSLTFTSDTNYPLLNTMKVGDYVAYEGNNGCLNESGTSGTSDASTEASNSCLGENANQSSDSSGYTYGYCYNSSYKYYVTGWRIAYIDNNKVHLISAGAPECRTRTSSTGNATAISDLNTAALDYCNSSFVDGGSCSSSNTWAMGNDDFKKITKAISGTESNLTSAYGSPYCRDTYSQERCGYNNDLIDNGGYYWFAAYYTSSSTNGVYWYASTRFVYGASYTIAYGLRPIISLASTVYVTGGSGTMDDPYTIGNS